MNGVPGVGDDGELGARDSNSHLPGNADKFSIESTGHQQDRHVDLIESVPIRWLRALTHAAKTIRQPNSAITKPNFALELENPNRQRALAAPDREPLPLMDEHLGSDFYDPPREFLIRLCPLESFLLMLNTGGSALQNQRGDPLRVIDGHPERQPAAHRVAQPGSSRDAELRRDLGEVVQSLLKHIM